MWYRTGTASFVNGNVNVTGVGTLWNSNTAAGEALLGPDGNIYEIANVVSDTSLTLGSAYLGVNASGAAYAIAPTQGYLRDLAGQAAALVATYSSFATGPGAGKFAAGTAALPSVSFAADVDTGAWNPSGNVYALSTGGVERVRIDSSGNVGIGASPMAWGSAYRAVTSYFQGGFFTSNGGKVGVSSNCYHDGANWLYGGGNPASKYEFGPDGAPHRWFTAPAGVLNTSITFTERMQIEAGGALLVGQSVVGLANLNSFSFSPAAANFINNHASGVAGGTSYQLFAYGGGSIGSITQSGTTAVAYNTTSDYRLKYNQKPLTGSGAFIDSLQPKTWNWVTDGAPGVGFIAHEVQAVSPGSVVGEKDAVDAEGKPVMQAMEYGSAEFIANIVAELQSLRARVAALEA